MKICVYGFESKSQQSFWPFQELHSRYSDSLKPSWRPRSDAALLFKQDVFFQGSIHFVGSAWVSGFASASASSSKPWATTFRTDSEQIQNRFRTDSEQIQNRNNQNRTEPANRGFPVDFYKGMAMTSGPCGTSLRGSGGIRPCGTPKSSTNGVTTPGDAASRHVGIEGMGFTIINNQCFISLYIHISILISISMY
jgi:hypothetical protein